MENKAIKAILNGVQEKHSTVKWGFKVSQTKKTIKIGWGYLDYIGAKKGWTIEEGNAVYNEQGVFMNYELEDTSTVEAAAASAAYYMISHY